jgi:hypothetical protein
VVATVGCVDLSPAWLDQLAPGGFALVPLLHGAVHPLVRARGDGPRRAVAELVGRSGFVAIQGRQARRSPWSAPGPPPPGALETAPAGAAGGGGPALWDLGFFVAISDRRAGPPASLHDQEGSGAFSNGVEVAWYGPGGPALRDRLVALAEEWTDLGRPPAEGFACRFDAPAGPGMVGRGDDGRWVVDRLDYRQVLDLTSSPR